jgi:hypothetical protein
MIGSVLTAKKYSQDGGVAERSNASVLKTEVPSRGPGVRIPPPPPIIAIGILQKNTVPVGMVFFVLIKTSAILA